MRSGGHSTKPLLSRQSMKAGLEQDTLRPPQRSVIMPKKKAHLVCVLLHENILKASTVERVPVAGIRTRNNGW